MDKLDYQAKIAEILDNALNDLSSDDFEDFIQSIKEAIEDCN